MKLFNQRTLIAAALATAFVGVSASAIAQGMGMSPELHTQHMAQRAESGGEMGQKHAQRMERMQKYHAERQAQLKAELKLTPAQEPAWNAFVARTAPEPRGPMAGAAREDGAQLTTPQRLDKMQALRAERDAAMTRRIDATRSFYAALTPEQQKVFDAKGDGGFQRAGMKGEHRMGGQQKSHGMHDKAGMGGGRGCDGPMQPRS